MSPKAYNPNKKRKDYRIVRFLNNCNKHFLCVFNFFYGITKSVSFFMQFLTLGTNSSKLSVACISLKKLKMKKPHWTDCSKLSSGLCHRLYV